MTAVLDWTELLALRAYQTPGESDIVLDLIDTFRRQTPLLVARLQDAAAQDDIAAVRRDAHTLKGSAGTIGALSLSREAAELEASARRGDTNVGPLVDRVVHAAAVVDRCLSDGPPSAR
jgi:HPt (histidine-containing phosphotransfer) domain-containing protein